MDNDKSNKNKILKSKDFIIFPASHIGYIETLYSMKSNEEGVLAIYEPGFVKYHHPPGDYLVDDFSSEDLLIKKIERWKQDNDANFIGIISIDDEAQFELTKKIAKHFSLDFYDDKTLTTASNKYVMKKEFQKNNVPTTDFELIDSVDNEKIERIGFPNVLKIITGSGSEYVFLNKTPEKLKINFEKMRTATKTVKDERLRQIIYYEDDNEIKVDPRIEYLLEAFAAGEEFSCDFATIEGKTNILRVVKKFYYKHFGCYKGFHLINEKTMIEEGFDLEILKDICANIAKSLGIQKGVCMVDFKVDNRNINVIETSIRPGFSAFIPLMQMIYGYSSIMVMSKIKKGETINVKIPDTEGLVVYLIAKNGGKIKAFDTSKIESLKNELDIIDIHKFEEVGDTIHDEDHDHSDLVVGYVLIKNPDKNKIKQIFKTIEDNADIVVVNEE